MGPKRSYSEVDASDRGRGAAAPNRSGPARKKQRRPAVDNTAKEESINWVKKRARDIQRRFQSHSDSIPVNQQKALERELASLQARIADFEVKKERSNMIRKYHMIRFFGTTTHPVI